MNRYTMHRFQPGHEDHAEEVRTITAESEDEAYQMIGEPIDGSYWQITDCQHVSN
jgi:hypothetical protein